jgi:Zn-dependent protease with chaperone function
VPVNPGFVTWCECGWNLAPVGLEEPRTALERMYRQLGDRSGGQLLEEMLGSQNLKPQWTAEKVFTFILAGLVYGLILTCFVTGLWLIVQVFMGALYFPVLVPAVLLLGLGALGVMPPQPLERSVLARTQYPALYAVLERVTKTAGGQHVPALVVDSTFNATMGRYGWSQRPVMTLGLPLWVALEPQERVALLGHEIGHSVNGDNLRSWFFWGAVSALEKWQTVLRPQYLFQSENPLYAVLRLPFYPVLMGLSGIAYVWLRALATLSFRDSQRAEYLADAVSAQCAGTDAALNLQWKVLLSRTADETAQRTTLERTENFFSLFKEQRAKVPTRELMRLQRIAGLIGTRLDHTHPQNAFRQQFLKQHFVTVPGVKLEGEEARALSLEMEGLQRSIERELSSRYRDRLYAG